MCGKLFVSHFVPNISKVCQLPHTLPILPKDVLPHVLPYSAFYLYEEEFNFHFQFEGTAFYLLVLLRHSATWIYLSVNAVLEMILSKGGVQSA